MKRQHIDQILAAKREQQQRAQCALDAVLALDHDSRQDVLIRLIEMEERGTIVAPSTDLAAATGSFIDRAGAYVKAHPEGTKRAAIADAIKQPYASIGKTLATLVERNEIELRGKLWFPKTDARSTNDEAPSRTLREEVIALFEAAPSAVTADVVHARLQSTRPTLRKAATLDMIDALEAADILLADSDVDGKPTYRLRPSTT